MPQEEQKEEEMSLGKLRGLARDQLVLAQDAAAEIKRRSNILVANKVSTFRGNLVGPAELRRIQNRANAESARINRLIKKASK